MLSLVAYIRPFYLLSRWHALIGVWLLFLPCMWGIVFALHAELTNVLTLQETIAIIVLSLKCLLGAILMRGAGCTWNDIVDRDIDARVIRTRNRPLPAGLVSVRAACLWALIQSACAGVVLLTLPRIAIGIAMLAIVPVLFYPFAKRFMGCPQIVLGFTFNWGVFLGFAAITGNTNNALYWLYAAAVLWTLFYDTIYAHQDRICDESINIKSTARLFAKHPKLFLSLCAGFASFVMAVAIILVYSPHFNSEAGRFFVAMLAPLLFLLHMLWQVHCLVVDDPSSCAAWFNSNKITGLLPILVLLTALII